MITVNKEDGQAYVRKVLEGKAAPKDLVGALAVPASGAQRDQLVRSFLPAAGTPEATWRNVRIEFERKLRLNPMSRALTSAYELVKTQSELPVANPAYRAYDNAAIADLVMRINADLGASRVLAADLLWLFFYDRMGVFRTHGALLDDFQGRGRFPLNPDDEMLDDVDAAVRGRASRQIDRDSAYRRVFSWSVKPEANSDTVLNPAFATAFRSFFRAACEYYRLRRPRIMIGPGAGVVLSPDTPTILDLATAAETLKGALTVFEKGSVQRITERGVIGAYEAMLALFFSRKELGIAHDDLEHVLPLSHAILVEERAERRADPTWYRNHKSCAEMGRSILFEIEATSSYDEAWIVKMEGPIETFRAAYEAIVKDKNGRPFNIASGGRLPHEVGDFAATSGSISVQ